MRTLICLFFCLNYTFANAQGVTLTPEQMKEDLTYLNKYLKKWHPSYYAYTKKETMDAYYTCLKDSCTMATSASDFRTMVRKAVNKIGCGHTSVYGYNEE